MSQIIIGFTTEGTTDVRLLEGIITRTFVEVGFECNKQIEVISPAIYIKKATGESFSTQVFQASKEAFEKGIMVFCVHVDADADNDWSALERIRPSFRNVFESGDLAICKNLIAVIPVHMSEAWMLADKQLLKEEIGTDKTDIELGIHFEPESFSDPKDIIKKAIMLARLNLTKRRRRDLSISELYQPIGQKIELQKLEALASYRKLKEAVRESYRQLNYLSP